MNAWVAACLVVGMIALSGTEAVAVPSYSDWSDPVNLGWVVNNASADSGPAFSRDGLSLFFGSTRLGGFGGSDLYVSQRATVDDPWGPALNLGATVNGPATENVPALSRDGHWLFFNSNRAGGFGGVDLWASYREHVHDDLGWQAPMNLGPGVNSASLDGGAGYHENDGGGAPLLYFISNRPGGLGGTDVYVSAQQLDGSWGPAAWLPGLSSPQQDQRPTIRFDGLEMFLASSRDETLGGLDLWVSTRENATDSWGTPANLGATVNTPYEDNQPYIGADRTTLYMSSDRPGGFGNLDLYVTYRTRGE